MKIVFRVILITVLLTALFTGCSNHNVSDINVEEKNIEIIPNKQTLTSENVFLGSYSQSKWFSHKDLFKIVYSDDDWLDNFKINKTSDKSSIYILPSSNEYETAFKEVYIEGKTITIMYVNENPSIDRLYGQDKLIRRNIFKIDFTLLEKTKYNILFKNAETNKITQKEEFYYEKPFEEIEWKVSSLTWGKENQLIYASNYNHLWELWEYNVVEKDIPKLLLKSDVMNKKYLDIPLNQFPSLGDIDVNIPKAEMSTKGTLIYSKGYDIWEVKPSGYRNIPLTNTNMPIGLKDDLHIFNYYSKPSPTNKDIAYIELSDPLKTELWVMNSKGENKRKIFSVPENFILDYEWLKDGTGFVILVSNYNSELNNGRSKIYTIDLETNEIRKLNTIGYKIYDFDLSDTDNKSIAFSMNEFETTSVLNTDIFFINKNNTELNRLTPQDDYMDITPVWSPNGNRIAYLTGNDGFFSLAIMDKNGENREILTKNIKVIDKPLWDKDGKNIYIADKYANIYKVNVEKKESTLIINGWR